MNCLLGKESLKCFSSDHSSRKTLLDNNCNNGCPFIRFSHPQNQILIHKLIYGLILPFHQSSLSKLGWQLLNLTVQIDSNSLYFLFNFYFQLIFVPKRCLVNNYYHICYIISYCYHFALFYPSAGYKHIPILHSTSLLYSTYTIIKICIFYFL